MNDVKEKLKKNKRFDFIIFYIHKNQNNKKLNYIFSNLILDYDKIEEENIKILNDRKKIDTEFVRRLHKYLRNSKNYHIIKKDDETKYRVYSKKFSNLEGVLKRDVMIFFKLIEDEKINLSRDRYSDKITNTFYKLEDLIKKNELNIKLKDFMTKEDFSCDFDSTIKYYKELFNAIESKKDEKNGI